MTEQRAPKTTKKNNSELSKISGKHAAVLNFIVSGSLLPGDKEAEKTIKEDPEGLAILLLNDFVGLCPEDMLSMLINIGFNSEKPTMVPVAYAILLSRCSSEFREKNYKDFVSILLFASPEDLLLIVELLKSKAFGRGLGSFNQKLIRKAMEEFNVLDLEEAINKFPFEMMSLVKIIHPRYSDSDRAKVIYELFHQ